MRILCYGDSNTYGYDPRSYLGSRFSESVRWTALLEAEGFEIINGGENGRSIPRLDWETESVVQAVRQTDPEVLIIMLGTNDLLQGLTAETCSERMERFLAALLRSVSASLTVLLVAPPPAEPGDWVPGPAVMKESLRLTGHYEALAKKLNIRFADAGKWGVELAFDGVHFSGEGHRAFAEGMLEALNSGGRDPALPCKLLQENDLKIPGE